MVGLCVFGLLLVCFSWSRQASSWESDDAKLYARPYAFASYLSIMGAEGIAQSHWFVESAHRLALSWARHVPESKRLEYDMILLVTDPYDLLNSQARLSLREVGWILVRVEPLFGIPSASLYLLQNHYTHTAQFTKLRLWTFERYQHILYLDSDMLIMKDVIHAVSGYNTSQHMLAAARNGDGTDYFNAGLLYITPSMTEYGLMTQAMLVMNYDASLQEQAFLNVYWTNRTIFMPSELNTFVSSNPKDQLGDQIIVLHFIGTMKPWFICPFSGNRERGACVEWDSYDSPEPI